MVDYQLHRIAMLVVLLQVNNKGAKRKFMELFGASGENGSSAASYQQPDKTKRPKSPDIVIDC